MLLLLIHLCITNPIPNKKILITSNSNSYSNHLLSRNNQFKHKMLLYFLTKTNYLVVQSTPVKLTTCLYAITALKASAFATTVVLARTRDRVSYLGIREEGTSLVRATLRALTSWDLILILLWTENKYPLLTRVECQFS